VILPNIIYYHKTTEIETFEARHEEYDVIKHSAAFYQRFMILSPKKDRPAFSSRKDFLTCYL